VETYVITGSLAAEFKKFLDQRIDHRRISRYKQLPSKPKTSIELIKAAVSEKYLPDGRVIEENCNEHKIVRARNIAMYLSRVVLNMSYPEIARHFGGKHHTTVMYGVGQVRSAINEDPLFSVEMSDLEKELTVD